MSIFVSMESKLKKLAISPIFFIGSGISRRYINSPDWKGLLQEIRSDWERSYKYYYQKHLVNGNCNFEELASELETMYFDKLTDEELEEGKDKRYYFRKRISEIVGVYLEKSKEIIKTNNEIEELKKTSPSAIITTNYDELMENIFPQYTKFVGQTQLLANVVEGVGEIYKIHGCSTNPESIVISKEDYDNFFDKALYLNSKLLTLFLEYPIIFMGYSLSDRNVKSILSSIVGMLPPEKVRELSSRIWFLRRNKDGENYKKVERIELDNSKYIDVETFYVNNFGEFFKVISNKDIKRLPIKFLRFLKANTYELISTQEYDPKKLDVNLQDLERVDNFNDSSNFLGITISSRVQKSMVKRSDICEVFIQRDSCAINKYSILDYILKNNEKIPIYWAIKGLNKEEVEGYIEKSNFNTNAKERVKKKIFESGGEGEKFKLYIGADSKIRFSYSGKINDDEISIYLNEVYKSNNTEPQRRKGVRRYFLLYLLNNFIDELSKNNEFLLKNRNEILIALTYLEKGFIEQNENKLYELIKILNDKKYDNSYRTVLCYLDVSLNKHL
ncbi:MULTISPECIES: SIR2 family protein [Clostridium]|uniref:SIR2 family protein n=1 Tax=Clostridium TaxID=1485 RepID=UPI000288D873|nr:MULTISPECIES: SIR2 family protein [Clostridium]